MEEERPIFAIEVCDYLGITRNTLWKYVHELGLPEHKIKGCRPYYLKSEVFKWLTEKRD